MESDCQPKLLFHYLFFFCRSTTNSQASTHSSSGGSVHFLDYNLDYNQLTEVIEGTYSKIWWPSAHQYVCKVLSDAPCSSSGVYTALKGASSSYPSSTAAKFQCKHFSAQPQRPQKPHTHTPPPQLLHPDAGCTLCHHEVTGRWMASLVQCRLWEAFSLCLSTFEFTQQEWVVVVLEKEEEEEGGGGIGVLLPLLRVTSPSKPSFLPLYARLHRYLL